MNGTFRTNADAVGVIGRVNARSKLLQSTWTRTTLSEASDAAWNAGTEK